MEYKAVVEEGGISVHDVAIHWIGTPARQFAHYRLLRITTHESHQIAEEVRHELIHTLPTPVDISVHADPYEYEKNNDRHHHIEYHLLPATNQLFLSKSTNDLLPISIEFHMGCGHRILPN